MSDKPTIQLASLPDVEEVLYSDRFLDRLAEKVAANLTKVTERKSKVILSDVEAAKRLHISVRTLSRMKKAGTITTIQTGKGRKVRECDIAEYVG